MCRAALERFSTRLASELYTDNIAVNAISPGLVATLGAVHHKLVNDSNRKFLTPVEHVAEACLRLCVNEPEMITGRVTYASDIMQECNLAAAPLLA